MTGQHYMDLISSLEERARIEFPPTFPRRLLDKLTGKKGFHRTFANLMSDKGVELPMGIALRKGREVYIVRDIFLGWYYPQFQNITSAAGGRNA